MSNYLIQSETLTGIADAIRGKTGSADLLSPIGMAAAIAGIQTGGGSGVAEKEVNFYDYDGTLLYSYSVEEAQTLSELPTGPERAGLVFQKWNWALENVKALAQPMNIGALYTTDDGTTRIYIYLEEGRTSPMLGIGVNGTVTVDWGDGTEPDTLTGTSVSTGIWTGNHEYGAAGEYVIRLTVDGTIGFMGSSVANAHACILRYSSSDDTRNYVYLNAVRRVECGEGVTSIGDRAFNNCTSLASITIPDSVTSIGDRAFNTCTSLASITIPDSVTSIGDYAFGDCTSLASITIPDSVTSIGNYAFNTCRSLASITIPDSVTSIGSHVFYGSTSLASITIPNRVTSINTYVFNTCRSLASITIPNRVTSIGSFVFYGCYGMAVYDFSRHTAVPTLSSSNAFTGIPADCEIRVPAALYDEWIAATNWATYANQIVAV